MFDQPTAAIDNDMDDGLLMQIAISIFPGCNPETEHAWIRAQRTG